MQKWAWLTVRWIQDSIIQTFAKSKCLGFGAGKGIKIVKMGKGSRWEYACILRMGKVGPDLEMVVVYQWTLQCWQLPCISMTYHIWSVGATREMNFFRALKSLTSRNLLSSIFSLASNYSTHLITLQVCVSLWRLIDKYIIILSYWFDNWFINLIWLVRMLQRNAWHLFAVLW